MNLKLQARLRRERAIKLIAVAVVILLALIVLFAVDHMLVSFVMAFVTNYLLAPIVDVLERRGLPRQAAILLPFIATGALMAFGIYEVLPLLTSQATSLAARLPTYQVDLMNLIANSEERFKVFFSLYNGHLSATLNSWFLDKTASLSSLLPSAVSGSLTVLLLTPIFSYFMLQDGRAISRKLMALIPNSFFETAMNLHHQLNDQMGGFIRARFIEAAIVGFVVWIGLQILGFPYASLLGFFAAITNLIPYLGPLIGALPAIIIAMFSPDAMVTSSMSLNLILVTSIFFIAQLIDVIFIIPMVVAKIVNLHPVTVIIVIIIGSQVKGILGMVISIPVASALKLISLTIYDHLVDFRS